MQKLTLDVVTRDANTNIKQLRREGFVPAVFYGHKQENLHLTISYRELLKVFREAGENSLIDLLIDEGKFKQTVLVHDVQHDPVTGKITHMDFIHVNLKEEVETNVPLEFIGVSPAVKNMGGVLIILKDHLEIKCLPQDLLHKLEVDVSVLEEFHSVIHVKDLKLSEKITVLDDPESGVVTVAAPKLQEEAEALEKPETAVEAEAAGEDKKQEGAGQSK